MSPEFEDLNPAPRLLMGPGPVNADPRVLRAMSMQLLGQFDPQFRDYMKQTSELYRGVFQTKNRWTLMVDGTARSAIEAALVSVIEPGDKVLVPMFGRFGSLKIEIARRCGADLRVLEVPWGSVFSAEQLEAEIKSFGPKLVAVSHGDTSTTMAQPLKDLGAICRAHGALLYVDATATLGGMDLPVDAWNIDIASAGLQKCLAGPSGIGPLTLNERAEKHIVHRRHTEEGLRMPGMEEGEGPAIRSNYFDLAMIMDYWSDKALNHHTEATTMLYGARECGRILMQEGLQKSFARHGAASRAVVAGVTAMGLKVYGDLKHKMANVTGVYIPDGINGDAVRKMMLLRFNIEMGTSFGQLHGKIWRIGAMGYNARPDAVLLTLGALEACLAAAGFKLPRGAAVDAAMAQYGPLA